MEHEDLFKEIQEYLANPVKDEDRLITDDEIERLILSLATSRGDEGFSEDEVYAIVNWVQETRVSEIMINLVLNGTCDVDLIGGEPAIKAIANG